MKMIILSAFVALTAGCLSVVRVPVSTGEKYSDEGVCTNRTWTVPLREIQKEHKEMWDIYPTIGMRWYATYSVYGKPINENLNGEALYDARMAMRFGWIPLTILWITSPLDGIVDTIALPFDLNVEE